MANLFTAKTGLVFIESTKINVFPCARRRSVAQDGKTYIPFDPEARLNTEANNRKHAGINGFAQNFIDFDSVAGKLSVVIAGYLFEVSYNFNTEGSIDAFGTAISTLINSTDSIYANIVLDDAMLFSESTVDNSTTIPAVKTKVLRDQQSTGKIAPYLDIYDETEKSYYFYGLSLSSNPIENANGKSLKILTKTGSEWCLNEEAKLPKIEHGEEADSVHIPGELTANTLAAPIIKQDGRPVVTLDATGGKYQLKITTGAAKD